MQVVEESVDAGRTTFLLFTRSNTPNRESFVRAMDRLLRRNPAVASFHVDLDNHPTAAGRYTIYRTPAFVIYHRHKMTNKVEGPFQPSYAARALASTLT